MHRLIRTTAAAAVLLLALAPATIAAGTHSVAAAQTGTADARGLRTSLSSIEFAIDEDVVIPAGGHQAALVVLDGNALIQGNVDRLVLVDGTATLEGATVRSIVAINGIVNLGEGTTVSDGIRVAQSQVYTAPTGVRLASMTDIEQDLALAGLIAAPVILLLIAGGLIAAAGITLLALAAGGRSLRGAAARMHRRPWHALVAGVLAGFLVPVAASALVVTIIGAPLGLAILLLGVPLLAFAGWLVAAVWLGDELLVRTTGRVTAAAEHPMRAAILGLAALMVLSIVPPLGAVATIMGTGGIVLAAGARWTDRTADTTSATDSGAAGPSGTPGSPDGDPAAGTGGQALWGDAVATAG